MGWTWAAPAAGLGTGMMEWEPRRALSQGEEGTGLQRQLQRRSRACEVWGEGSAGPSSPRAGNLGRKGAVGHQQAEGKQAFGDEAE